MVLGLKVIEAVTSNVRIVSDIESTNTGKVIRHKSYSMKPT